MDKDRLVSFLVEALTIEEVPALTKLAQVESLISQSDLDEEVKCKVFDSIRVLRQESVEHSKVFSDLLTMVLKSDKNEY